jgi:hypothetical protein
MPLVRDRQRPVEEAAVHDEFPRLIVHAAARGATLMLLSILAAEDEADVVRQRAFGRIAGQVTEPRRARV